MDYKELNNLINSNEIKNIREVFLDVKNSYEDKDNISNNTMEIAAKSICKFFKEQKTATFYVKEGSEHYYKKSYSINKNNLGYISFYGSRINSFEDIKDFFDMLLDKKFVDGIKTVLKPEGNIIIDNLVELANKYNLTSKRTYDNRISIKFLPTNEEREIFELEAGAYILVDTDGIYVNSDKDGNRYSSTDLIDNIEHTPITLRDIKNNDTLNITDMIFLINHEKEIISLLKDYKIKMDNDWKEWEKFKNEFNSKMAKYVLIDIMTGKK